MLRLSEVENEIRNNEESYELESRLLVFVLVCANLCLNYLLECRMEYLFWFQNPFYKELSNGEEWTVGEYT